jgi:cytochrome c oxidase cbb3-type subunit IV
MIPGIVTAILLVAFIGGCFWAYSPRRRDEFAAAAALAFDEPAAIAPVIHPADETLP